MYCSDDCCPPLPVDCKESLEETAPADWYYLTSLCNNKTSCQFQNPGRIVPSCAEPYQSDYASVHYSCLYGEYVNNYLNFNEFILYIDLHVHAILRFHNICSFVFNAHGQ